MTAAAGKEPRSGRLATADADLPSLDVVGRLDVGPPMWDAEGPNQRLLLVPSHFSGEIRGIGVVAPITSEFSDNLVVVRATRRRLHGPCQGRKPAARSAVAEPCVCHDYLGRAADFPPFRGRDCRRRSFPRSGRRRWRDRIGDASIAPIASAPRALRHDEGHWLRQSGAHAPVRQQQPEARASGSRFSGIAVVSPAERRRPLSALRLPAQRIVASSPRALLTAQGRRVSLATEGPVVT